MMPKLKILFLEDQPIDVKLICRVLDRGKFDYDKLVVDSGDGYGNALRDFLPDIILSDHTLPSFNSQDALKILQKTGLQIPFILVTGTMSEDFAVDMLRRGVSDYILKDRLERLPVAILNGLENIRLEKERQQMIDDLVKSEFRYRQIVETAHEGIWLLDENDCTTFVNKRMCDILEYPKEEILGKDNYHFMEATSKKEVLKSLTRRKKGVAENIDVRYITKSSRHVDTTISANPIFDDSGKYIGALGMVTDNTEKKALEIKLAEQRVQQHMKITKAVVTAQEKERSEIGEELHDNVNQLLAAAQLNVNYGLTQSDQVPHISKGLEYIRIAMDEIRKLSHALVGPSREDMMGLCRSVTELAQDMLVNKNIKFVFNHSTYNESDEESESESEEELKLVIYRIIQEQLSNIVKHASATEVKIELIKSALGTTAIIEDNGKGFDTSLKRNGIGLKNIRHRTEIHNGTVQIKSGPGLGCKITVSFGEQVLAEN